ncbi:MAG: L-seryl-tRNA(Sec) selenium transferase, partial [Deltaproteobacteria bacterium]|nr:L-seryl-tRNA(Sec) selenium transferase [Deltaproteobacteria bacterium]
MGNDALRSLPSVDSVLNELAVSEGEDCLASQVKSAMVRELLDELRKVLSGGAGASIDISLTSVAEEAARRVKAFGELGLERVVNASGTVLHTNLGRAVLSQEAIEAMSFAASGGVDLEFDTALGQRGERDARTEELLCHLTGAEAACVVGNNAGAVLITLNALAEGKEVLISRGELVEIGGSFRLPDVIEKSGCVMREVGTTNRTHPKDYRDAVTPDTAIIFKAHKSNYEVVGFTSEVDLPELVGIGRENALPVVEDLGSG